MTEFDLINKYISTQSLSRADVLEGIGDDCAILNIPETKSLAVSLDTLVEDVHFPANTTAYSIGYKSLAVNLSDLAATGAEPAWITLSLAMPEANEQWIKDFLRGVFDLADKYNVQLIGGDTTQGKLTISIQAHGFVDQPLLRSGAQTDDLIYVSGYLGDSVAGFEQFIPEDENNNVCITRFKRPEPRVELGLAITNIASSCIDISDGLVSDLGHVCKKSQKGAIIYLTDIPLSEEYCQYYKGRDYKKALSFGDDYELCFTVPKEKSHLLEALSTELGINLSCIGKITDSDSIQFVDAGGELVKLNKGYEHFNE